MRSLVLSLGAFAISALTLSGCCGTLVQGEVRTMDHIPIEGARITVDETGAVRFSNQDGRYSVALPCRAEPFLVRVLADGYPEVSDIIDSPGGHITRNFVVGGDESGAPQPRPGSRDSGAPAPRDDYEPEPEYRPEPEPERPVRRDPPPRRDPPARRPPPRRTGSQSADTPSRPCPDCDTEVPRGDTNCPSCGARYIGANAPTPPRRARPPADRSEPARTSEPARAEPARSEPARADTGGKSCPACGTSVPKGERDCGGCGATVLD